MSSGPIEQIQSQKVIAANGLTSSTNYLDLSDNDPGGGVELQNFESSLYGGYRRIDGFQPLTPLAENVDPTNAEGRILGLAFYGDTLIAMRKQKSGPTYKFYRFTGSTWSVIAGSPTPSVTTDTKVRATYYNFDGREEIAFADGTGNALLYDGTNWGSVNSSGTGVDYAHAGGDQAVNGPSLITNWKNTLWIAQNNLLVYSAPLKSYNWTAAAGSGQMPAGFIIKQIYPFRDALYVFGESKIKKVVQKSTSDSSGNTTFYFAFEDVTMNIGCLAADSVQEINGNLIFLSQDGFRPVEGTARIGDVELETISKRIQRDLTDAVVATNMNDLCSVLVRSKSQVRFFFSQPDANAPDVFGFNGCLRDNSQGQYDNWEWFRLKGINASCATSRYVAGSEWVVHGDYDGNVYRQESGNSFNGMPVEAIYRTPYLDFGAATVRKTLRKVRLFISPEGNTTLSMNVKYDWGDPYKLNPDTYGLGNDLSITTTLWDDNSRTYDVNAYYGQESQPLLFDNIEGTGFSTQFTYTTSDTNAPYTIHGAIYDFSINGKK